MLELVNKKRGFQKQNRRFQVSFHVGIVFKSISQN